MSETTNQKVWTIKTLSEALGWSMGSIYQKAKHFPPPMASVNKGRRVWGDDQLEGKAIAMFDSVERSSAYVKHHCPDGVYQVIGSDTDCIFELEGGIVYPTAGTVDGQRLPSRTLAEAKECFGQPTGGAQ